MDVKHPELHYVAQEATKCCSFVALMTWEVQSRRVRQTQSKLDAKLTAYSQYVSEVARHGPMRAPSDAVAVDMSGTSTPSAPPDHTAMEADIQSLLVQYSEELDELASSMNDPLLPPNSTQVHTIQRHRELLVEFEREFFRSKTNVRQALDRQQLLGHVKQDIHDYRTQHATEVQAYLDERTHLERSHRMVDETLDQAYATQNEFRAQREQLSGTLTRLTHIAAQMPGIQSIIALISRRRRRDSVILAVVIGVCIVALLLIGVRR